MCTVSLVSMTNEAGPAVRLACNRDESHQRPPATPPQLRRCGDLHALMPIDPVSGGTWVGVNEAGLVMTLMNIYPVPFDREAFLANAGRYLSRGTIVPLLLECETLARAAEQAASLESRRYPAFRLLIADRHRRFEITASGMT